jgi:hypothetical protein
MGEVLRIRNLLENTAVRIFTEKIHCPNFCKKMPKILARIQKYLLHFPKIVRI